MSGIVCVDKTLLQPAFSVTSANVGGIVVKELTADPIYIKPVAKMRHPAILRISPWLVLFADKSWTNRITRFIKNGCANLKPIKVIRGKIASANGPLRAEQTEIIRR